MSGGDDIRYWNTSNTTNLNRLFAEKQDCSYVNRWNVSNVKNMRIYYFYVNWYHPNLNNLMLVMLRI